ncbi:MAG: FHA domain-containing protein, partial [Pyrinomonadaceae bacterium]
PASLVIEWGDSTGKRFYLGSDKTEIGRWDGDNGIFPDIDLDQIDPETKVSRRHARITRLAQHDSDTYFIEDLNSTNGPFINRGKRLVPGVRVQLRNGDEIITGKTFFRFHVEPRS